jgi:membrane-bound ClpP family serine protease
MMPEGEANVLGIIGAICVVVFFVTLWFGHKFGESKEGNVVLVICGIVFLLCIGMYNAS